MEKTNSVSSFFLDFNMSYVTLWKKKKNSVSTFSLEFNMYYAVAFVGRID